MSPSDEKSLKELSKLSDAAAACNRCGFCTSFCPTYKATGNEAHSPRGRNQLVRAIMEGKIADAAAAAESIDTCLLCGECTSVCFSEVPTASLMIAARAHLVRTHGVPKPLAAALDALLNHPNRLRIILKIAFFFRKIGFAWLARTLGLLRRFPVLAAGDEQLPHAPLQFLNDRADARPRLETTLEAANRRAETAKHTGADGASAAPWPKVAFFAACGEQYARPSTGVATLKLLERLKIDAVIPDAVCCGLPAASYGVLDSVRAFAKENIARLEKRGYDAIVVDDSSCGAHLREYAAYLAEDPAWAKRAADLIAKERDAATFFLERGLADLLAKHPWSGGPVAFHDPCKSQYATKLTRAPRELMNAIPNLKVVPVTEADQCCGGAGTFAVVHPELSRKVVSAKAAHVRDAGCAILVTSSVSCLIQLAAGLRRAGVNAEVMHLTEFLERALARGK